MLKFSPLMQVRPFITLRLIVLATALSSLGAAQQKAVIAEGVWASGQTVIVFARLESCADRPYPPRQPFVSHDGGKTWNPSGPRLEGSDFKFILGTGSALWVAGEGYAEGPTHNPFLRQFGPDNADWPEFEIYSGDAELKAIALEEKTGEFRAWAEHIDTASDDSPQPVFLHQSLDGGQTWEQTRQVRRIPKSVPGLRFFQEIPNQSGPWRISGADDAPVVEHRQPNGKWQRVPDLPPQPCTAND